MKASELGSVIIAGAAFVLVAAQRLVAAGPAGDPEPRAVCQHLPNPLPDLVAMVKAERPVTLKDRPWPGDRGRAQELEEIELRYEQGDQMEAVRLYELLADRYPGTQEAAQALWLAARHLSSAREPDDIERLGRIARRIADENRTHWQTPWTLHMYVSQALNAMGVAERQRRVPRELAWVTQPEGELLDPSPEEWHRLFRAVAILAGRYPKEEVGPKCLFRLAALLATQPRPQAKTRALEIHGLVSEWPEEWDWDLCFLSYRALHDEAVGRGDLKGAERMALTAAKRCAGKMSFGPHQIGSQVGQKGEPETSWQKMLSAGLPSTGRVLLAAPVWRRGDVLHFKAERFLLSDYLAGLHALHKDSRDTRGTRDANEDIVVRFLGPGKDGLFAAMASRRFDWHCWWSGGVRPTGLEFALLSDARVGDARPTSVLFLPKFPVREGVEIFRCRGLGLIQQKARVAEGKVRVEVLAGGQVVWRQTWSGGEPWWDEAEMSCGMLDSRDWEAPILGWGEGRYTWCAKRAGRSDVVSPESGLKLEREALEQTARASVRARFWPLALARLPELFSGEKLAALQAKWRGEPGEPEAPAPATRAQPASTKSRAPAEGGAEHRSQGSGPFSDFRLRSVWRPSKGLRELDDLRVERSGRGATILVHGYAKWRWRITPDGRELKPPDDAEPPTRDLLELWWPVRRPRAARTEFARRDDTVFTTHADRLIAERASGGTLWVYKAPTRAPRKKLKGAHMSGAGIPHLADPQLVRCSEGDRIICGVGQRTVWVTMGICYGPAGGGLIAMDLTGKVAV